MITTRHNGAPRNLAARPEFFNCSSRANRLHRVPERLVDDAKFRIEDLQVVRVWIRSLDLFSRLRVFFCRVSVPINLAHVFSIAENPLRVHPADESLMIP